MTLAANVPSVITDEEVFHTNISAKPTRLHLDHLEGLRACAALWVVLGHLTSSVILHGGPLAPSPYAALHILLFVRFAVPVFIVISGYCLMLPLARKADLRLDAGNFYFRRARRILPPYYVALLLFALTTRHHDNWQVISHFLLIHNLTAHTFLSINQSFWSIAVECQIYALFPLLLLGWRRWGAARFLALAMVVSCGVQAVAERYWFYGITAQYIALFLMGALAAMIAHNPEAQWQAWRTRLDWNKIAGGLLLGSLLLLQFVPVDPVTVDITWYSLPAAIVTACGLVALSFGRPTLLKRFFTWRPLVFLGGFSYSLYLVHQPITMWLAVHVPQRLHNGPAVTLALLIVFAVPAIIAFAYLFHCLFERPFMNSPARKRVTA